MWMRSCPLCKALLEREHPLITKQCVCGWEWSGGCETPPQNFSAKQMENTTNKGVSHDLCLRVQDVWGQGRAADARA